MATKGTESVQEVLVKGALAVMRDDGGQEIPRNFLEEAAQWCISNNRVGLPFETDDEKRVLNYARFAHSCTTDSSNEMVTQSNVVAAVPQGGTAEEKITLDVLHQKLLSWVHHWRSEFFDRTEAPFDTVEGGYTWCEDILGWESIRSPQTAEANQVSSTTHNDKKHPITDSDQYLIDEHLQRERESLREFVEFAGSENWQEKSSPDYSTPAPPSSNEKRFKRSIEILSSITGVSENQLLMFVLTGNKPTRTRYRIVQHSENGSVESFGWYRRWWVTIELCSPDITGKEIREKIIPKAKEHLRSQGGKHLEEKDREMWDLYLNMGGPSEYDTRTKFWTEFKSQWEKKHPEDDNQPDSYRRKFDRLFNRFNRRYPGLFREDTAS